MDLFRMCHFNFLLFTVYVQLHSVSADNCPNNNYCHLTEWSSWNCTGCVSGTYSAFRERGVCCSSPYLDVCLMGCNMTKTDVKQTDPCGFHCKTLKQSTNSPFSNVQQTPYTTIKNALLTPNITQVSATIYSNSQINLTSNNASGAKQEPALGSNKSSEDSVCLEHCKMDREWESCMTDCLSLPYPKWLCKIIWISLFIIGIVMGGVIVIATVSCINRRKYREKRVLPTERPQRRNVLAEKTSEIQTFEDDALKRDYNVTFTKSKILPATRNWPQRTQRSIEVRAEQTEACYI